MDTIESFSEFLKKIGTPNFLAIGIAIILLWLLISGILKGMKKRKEEEKSEGEEEEE